MKNVLLKLFCGLLFLSLGEMIPAQTFNGSTGSLTDNTGGPPCASNHFTATVSGIGGTTATLNRVNLDITHTFDGDLDIFLVSPAGTIVELSTDNGGSGDNYTSTEFSDIGIDGNITAGTAPFTGSYIPEGSLSTFTGECMEGTWTLQVCDDASGDSGVLNSWSVTFTAGAACGGGGGCTGTSFSGASGSLTDNTGGPPCSANEFTASVSGIGQVGATLNCVDLDITHSFDGDLDIFLVSPAGTSVELSTDNGGSGDNYTSTNFSDSGADGPITSGTAPFTGSYIPEQPLSTFDGECMDGNWMLQVCDDASGDSGVLNSWSLKFTAGAPICPPVNDACGTALPILPDPVPNTTGNTDNATNVEGLSFCSGPNECEVSVLIADFTAGVWFKYTSALPGEIITVSTNHPGTDFDTELQVFKGQCGTLVCVGDDDDSGAGTTSTFCWTSEATLAPAVDYFIYLDGHLGASGNYEISLMTQAPLPIELYSFTGKPMQKSNMLKWITTSEENTEFHIVERSSDGRNNWLEVGRTDAIGFTTQMHYYELEDTEPLSKSYYRLRTVDFDGFENISNVVYLERKADRFTFVDAYPIPTRNMLTIDFETVEDQIVEIQLTDMLGKTFRNITYSAIAGINTHQINMSNLATGVYFITIHNGNESITRRVMKN